MNNRNQNRAPSATSYIGDVLAIRASEGRRPGIFYRLELTPKERILFGVAPDVEASPRLILTVMLSIALEKGFAKDKEGNTVLAKRNSDQVTFTFVGKDGNIVPRQIPRADLEEALKRVKAVEEADRAEAEQSQAPKFGTMAALVIKAGVTPAPAKGAKGKTKGPRLEVNTVAAELGCKRAFLLEAMANAPHPMLLQPEKHGDTVPEKWMPHIVEAVALHKARSATTVDENKTLCTIGELYVSFAERDSSLAMASVISAAAGAGITNPRPGTSLSATDVAAIEKVMTDGVQA